MSENIQLQQGNRSERRRLQRMESKKWRKEEKKMMKSVPNSQAYNPKKSRRAASFRVASSTETNSTNSINPTASQQAPIVSIKNREFIIIDKVYDGDTDKPSLHTDDTTESNSSSNSLSNDSDETQALEEKLKNSQSTSFDQVEKENVHDDVTIINSDVKNVTVTEVPALNKNIDDENNETPTVKSDTCQEEKLQNVAEKSQNASIDVTFVEQEIVKESSLTLESTDTVPTLPEKALLVNSLHSTISSANDTLQLDTSDIKVAPTTDYSVPITIVAKSRNRKRTIISRLFKNNKIEIKQKSEKKVNSITEHPEKKKVKVWQIWKKL